jgi:TolB-like protein
MGEVWRARDPRLGREVAIKALPDAFAKDPERLARFEREAKLLASLSHPNIAAIFGLEDVDGAPFLVLELVEGESLAQRLARGPLSVREALELGAQVAGAIEAAHERGVVHRDLKPGNVMIASSRVVKVLDFGLAKGGALESGVNDDRTMASPNTAAGLVLGTSSYMSPEQARGLPVDRRTDVWAFGCVLFECLTGQLAFGGPTATDVLSRVLEREPEWNLLGQNVPQRLRDVVRRCLTKDQDERPRDIGDVRRELIAIERELSSPSSHASGFVAAPSLAVLYFENSARDPESEYFCGGITEDILTDLSKIGGLRVASRNAVARYRGQVVDLAKVGSDLGVTAVLEGSVRRAGDRVRISAQLVNAADGFHLWAERYDRTLDDVFAVQEEIASSIAQALRVALTPQEAANLAQNRPEDVRAYDLYLKGRQLYGAYTEASLREALQLFEQAIAIDPAYALAYAGVADAHGQLIQWGAEADPKEHVRLGLEAARKAIELNPRLPEAYKAQGLVLGFSGDDAGARAALLKGLEADPRHTSILINLCVDAYSHADIAGAERYARRALHADPQETFAMLWLASLCSLTGRYEEAVAIAHRVRKASDAPFYVGGSYSFRMEIELKSGNPSAIPSLAQEATAAGAPSAVVQPYLAMTATIEGRLDEARRSIEEIKDNPRLGFGPLVTAAKVAVRLGDVAMATQLMSRRLAISLSATTIRLDPGLHPLVGQPVFAPRRMDATLVWPLEAPMIDPACFRLFRAMKVESGLPES